MSERIISLLLSLICVIGCLCGCAPKDLTFRDSKTDEDIWMFSKFPALGSWKLTEAGCYNGYYGDGYYGCTLATADDYYLEDFVEKIIANNKYFSTFLHEICPNILDKYFAAYQNLTKVIEIECSEPIMCYDFIINDETKSNWSETDFYNDNRYARLIEYQYGDSITCSYYLEENHEQIKQAMMDYIQHVFEDYAISKNGEAMHAFECFSYTNGNTITAPLETISDFYSTFKAAYYGYIINNYYSNWKIKLMQEKGIDGTKTGIKMQVSDQNTLCHFGAIAFKNSSGDYKGYYDIRGKVGIASSDQDLYFTKFSYLHGSAYRGRYFIINDGIYCRKHLDYDHVKCIDNFLEGNIKMVYCEEIKEKQLFLTFSYDDDDFVLQFEKEK